ncbi:response regulator [Parapedobacter sp. ISTM3]|uniref:Response regulator receiver domain-containing protein n=1 Tax=Parapedobacter luteus TaxID=623280 RepID=A0A1T5CAR1_9SPHI|nr:MULTISPECIES: response regulator [Parapedobacter]MBK1439114.1 response regulator [Parapedobacter sp. ISTM3]SKB56499.1 Response regulator receiver domain-containing protein [Parapedobacter luteus]
MMATLSEKIQLVLADDCAFQRRAISMLVESLPAFELIAVAEDGLSLINQLCKLQTLPGACILDLHMPEMDGITTANELSGRFPSIKLFGYTSTEDRQAIDQFKGNGALSVFPKDQPIAMLEAIEHYIREDA